jgi:PhnB protein
MNIQPYLFFEGRCEEAIAFYREALGAEQLVLMRYSDGPEQPTCPDGSAPPPDKIMHATLQIGEAQIMLSDGLAKGKPEFKGVSLSLSVAVDRQARQFFNALAVDGQVQMPLGPTFFASSFGMVTDRFGVAWMVAAFVPPAG